MGKPFQDLTGMKFGKLKVLERAYKENQKGTVTFWLCICDCSDKTKRVVRAWDLKTGHTKSCGCWNPKNHGMSKTKIYGAWLNMKARCSNGNVDYGGRGISVCEEWLDRDRGFLNFYLWSLNNGYSEDLNLSIDRVDVNGNYEPSNCRWATIQQQANNKRNTIFLEFEGVVKPLKEWADIYGVDRAVVNSRILRGYTKKEDIFRKVDKNFKRPEECITKAKNGKFLLRIRKKHIGTYDTIEEAIKIRDKLRGQ